MNQIKETKKQRKPKCVESGKKKKKELRAEKENQKTE